MAWPETIIAVLKKHRIRFVNYVPDAKNGKIVALAQEDPHFAMVPLTREEEGIGLVCGQAAGGTRGVMLMPTAGL